MRRVVITGMGIVSSIGNNSQEVLASLHEAKSGITRADKYAEMGFRSQVQGAPTLNPADVIDRRALRFLAELHRTFEAARERILAARAEQQERYDAGDRPDFRADTRAIRDDDDWRVAPFGAREAHAPATRRLNERRRDRKTFLRRRPEPRSRLWRRDRQLFQY